MDQFITASGKNISTLSYLLWREEKITKPPRRPFQSSKQLWARPFQSSRQHGRAQINPPKQLWACPKIPLHITWPGAPSFYLPQQLFHPPPSYQGQLRHTPLHPSGARWLRCAASGLSVDIWRPPRKSHWSQDQAWLNFNSWIILAVEKTASESSAVLAWGRGHGVLACLMACL